MRPSFKDDPREWRKATWLSLLGLSVLASLLCWRRVLPARLWLFLLALLAAAALLCAWRPTWFRPWYRALTALGFYLVQALGRVLLLAVFLLILTPLGFCLRLAGEDLLSLRRRREAESYWQEARPPGPLDRLF